MAANAQDLAAWAQAAGWTGVDRAVAVAVALAAGADVASPKGAWGVGPGTDGPSEAKAAYSIWLSQGWPAFPAHRNGSWALFMPTAVAAAPPPKEEVTGPSAATNPDLNTLDELGVVARMVTEGQTYVRFFKIVVGAGMVFLGMAFVLKPVAMKPFHWLKRADDAVYRQSQLVPQTQLVPKGTP